MEIYFAYFTAQQHQQQQCTPTTFATRFQRNSNDAHTHHHHHGVARQTGLTHTDNHCALSAEHR